RISLSELHREQPPAAPIPPHRPRAATHRPDPTVLVAPPNFRPPSTTLGYRSTRVRQTAPVLIKISLDPRDPMRLVPDVVEDRCSRPADQLPDTGVPRDPTVPQVHTPVLTQIDDTRHGAVLVATEPARRVPAVEPGEEPLASGPPPTLHDHSSPSIA